MNSLQSYRSNIFCALMLFFASVLCQNVFCAYADFKQDAVNIAEPEPAEEGVVAPHAQNVPRSNPITWYVGLHQPDQQRRYDIELYPTKKSCCAVLGLVTFITFMILRLRNMHHDQPAPSIWQEDGCLPGCKSAFNASGALVNTSREKYWYGYWRPWIIGCNGDTRPFAYKQEYCGKIPYCMMPYPFKLEPDQVQWNPDDVTKEKMIAQIGSYCKTYEHIAFCHCDSDPEEGSCVLNPLEIVSHLSRFSNCKPPQDPSHAIGNSAKMNLKDRLKERLKTLKMNYTNNSSHVLRTKNNVRKQTIKQPRQRVKR